MIITIMLTLILLLCLMPVSGQDDDVPPADRLGIAWISGIDIPHDETRYERALDVGAGWNRWALYWDRVEAERDEFDWSAYDALVEADTEYGLNINAILLGMPEFYRARSISGGDTIRALAEPVFADGTDTSAPGKAINPRNVWARFVYAAVERYKPGGVLARERGWTDETRGIRTWEIWNEPDYPPFWSGGVAAFARLLKVAYLAAHQADADAFVMHGGLLYPTNDNWLASVLNLYVQETDPAANNWYMDGVAVHNYGDAWRTGWLVLVARQTMISFGFTRPIWVTETGVNVWDDYPGPTWMTSRPPANRATADEQAAFIIQSAAYAWAEGAEVVFYHQLYDDCGDQPPGTDFPPHNGRICRAGQPCFGDVYGMYTNPESAVCFAQHPEPDSARPVADAYRLLAEVFGSAPLSTRGEIDDARDDGVILIRFTRLLDEQGGAGERITVIWNTNTTFTRVTLPTDAETVQGITVGESYTYRAVDGEYTVVLPPAEMPRQRFLEADARRPVDIGGMPLILIEQLDDLLPSTPTPPPATGVYLSETQVEDLIDSSPTGAAFTAQQAARLRDAPSTETGVPVGTLPLGNSASIIGKTEAEDWLQIDYDGRLVWVAAFLGTVSGDLADVPVIEIDVSDATETPEGGANE